MIRVRHGVWDRAQHSLWRRALVNATLILTGCVTGAPTALAFGAFPPIVPVPADNPMTPAKIALGKQLFFDPRLSISGAISCDTCHNVASNGTDNLPLSFGVFGRVDTPVNAPTVFNAAFNTVQFWDGRAASLEAQAKGPITSRNEMGMPNGTAVVKRLDKIPGYRREFGRVFGGTNAITFNRVTDAIATYERTLIIPDSPYDRFVKGDQSALSRSAVTGMVLVRSMGCTTCHAGPMFDNPGVPMGTGWYQKFPKNPQYGVCAMYIAKYHLKGNLGRFLITHNPAQIDFFKVPGWRNVALTAPYFSYGTVKTLPNAVRVEAACQLEETVSTRQVDAIVAFLDSLTGVFPQEILPHLPETPNTTILMGVPRLTRIAERGSKEQGGNSGQQ